MTLQNHPDDERLAALAGADADATGDGQLTAHVAGCVRCRDVTADLRRLRAVLAELPDITPPAHLPRFVLPPVVPERRHAEAGTAHGSFLENLRRALAPAMVAGAALALVGAVGTSGYLDTLVPSGSGAAMPAAAPDARDDSAAGADGGAEMEAEPLSTEESAAVFESTEREGRTAETSPTRGAGALWVTLIVGGVAVVVGAFVLRTALRRSSG